MPHLAEATVTHPESFFKSIIELENGLPKSPAYEKAFVAFLDILGFREFLLRSGSNAPHLMIDAYRAFRFTRTAKYHFNSIEHRMFSDSVMLWCYHRNPHSFWNFINQVELVRDTFFSHGLIVRGGISYGDHFCASEVVVSDALIRAYKLEQTAVFPRIRVDDVIFDLPDMRIAPISSGAFIVPYGGELLVVSPGKIRADGELETCLCPFRKFPSIRYLLTGNPETRMPEDAAYSVDQLNSLREDGLHRLKTFRTSLLQQKNILPMEVDTSVRIKMNYLVREYNLILSQCSLTTNEKSLLLM